MCWLNATSISAAWSVFKLKYQKKTERAYTKMFENLIECCVDISLECSLSTFFTRLEDLENIVSTFVGRKASNHRGVLNGFNDYCLKQAVEKISDSLGKSLTPFSALPKHPNFSPFPTLLIAVRANTKLMNALADIQLVNTLNDALHNEQIGYGLEHIFLSNHVTRQFSLRDFVSHLEASCAGIQNAEKLAGSTKSAYVAARAF